LPQLLATLGSGLHTGMPTTALVADGRNEAFDLFALLDSKGYLNGDQRQTAPLVAERMPMGLKQHFGANNTVCIGFSKIVMNSQYAELTAFIKMEMMVDDGQTGTKKKKELFFGATGIKLTNNGKIIGEARLTLIGDEK
jgi:hypothetical protein